MGQYQPLELSEKEKEELSVGMLREWWITATQVLVEMIGSKDALKFLKPYFVNSGRAGAYHIKRLTGLPTDDAGSTIALWFGIGHHQGSKARVVVKASSKDYAIAEMTDCALEGACPEVCYCWCLYISYGGSDINPEYEIELIKCIPWGDEGCCFKISKKGAEPLKNPTINIPIPDVSPELTNFLSHAYMGEMWVNATRAFIDATGKEKVSEQLCVEMRRSGLTLGKKLAPKSKSIVDEPGSLVHWLNALHKKVESCSFDENCSMGEVTECPFSEAPLEICQQYESFYNGILESVNPDYYFAYDRMMTKGDKTCHWVVRKRMEKEGIKTAEKPIPDDPIRRLTNRFIDGEITEEELEKKLSSLRKLGLVK